MIIYDVAESSDPSGLHTRSGDDGDADLYWGPTL